MHPHQLNPHLLDPHLLEPPSQVSLSIFIAPPEEASLIYTNSEGGSTDITDSVLELNEVRSTIAVTCEVIGGNPYADVKVTLAGEDITDYFTLTNETIYLSGKYIWGLTGIFWICSLCETDPHLIRFTLMYLCLCAAGSHEDLTLAEVTTRLHATEIPVTYFDHKHEELVCSASTAVVDSHGMRLAPDTESETVVSTKFNITFELESSKFVIQ